MEKIDDLTLLHLLFQCNHLAHGHGKCHGQERLMIQLLKKGTMTQRELAEITCRRSATLSEQLDNMEKAGYILRERNIQDRRNVDVSLTEQGRRAAADMQEERIKRARELFCVLQEEEKEQLARILNRLLSSWEASEQEKEATKP